MLLSDSSISNSTAMGDFNGCGLCYRRGRCLTPEENMGHGEHYLWHATKFGCPIMRDPSDPIALREQVESAAG